ncbi:MAG: fatty acid desaturase [Cyanobacteria bacterium SBLK]|nr:fatty acid desaturase [Cyanobacteria bacterium SBLK]
MSKNKLEECYLPKNKLISYKELKKHSSYSDAWIAINGIVYDITDFIDRHPFGDTFRGNLGTDCSGLFSSAHINTNVEELIKSEDFLKKNHIKLIGFLDVNRDFLHKESDGRYLDRIVYQEIDKDEFWLELKTKVKEYLQENNESIHYSTSEGILYLLYYGILFLILSYLTWIQGSIFTAILLGFQMVCACAGVSHIVAHFGFTKNKLLNFLSLHFMDLSGFSWLEWQIIHQTHHNQPHSSIDHQTNQYAPLRIHQYVKYQNYHGHQHISFWLGLIMYHFRAFFMSTVWLIQNPEFLRHRYEIFGHILAKLIVFCLVGYSMYLHGFSHGMILFSIFSISFSYSAFLLLYNNHEETHHVLALNEDINGYHHQFSWAKTQVKTSGDWYPTNWILSFIEFNYGYFNYHIEHHLFPTFKPRLLKKIAPIVKSICHKHGVPYIATTYIEVQKSFQRHITKMSLPPEELAENLETEKLEI